MGICTGQAGNEFTAFPNTRTLAAILIIRYEIEISSSPASDIAICILHNYLHVTTD
jgi:hypothetical protein